MKINRQSTILLSEFQGTVRMLTVMIRREVVYKLDSDKQCQIPLLTNLNMSGQGAKQCIMHNDKVWLNFCDKFSL